MPFARNALITGFTSSLVRTKSPVMAALPPPVGWKLIAVATPIGPTGAIAIPPSMTGSRRGTPNWYTRRSACLCGQWICSRSAVSRSAPGGGAGPPAVAGGVLLALPAAAAPPPAVDVDTAQLDQIIGAKGQANG